MTGATQTCHCSLLPAQAPIGAEAFKDVGSKVRVTNMKAFGVSLTPDSDRPYVFVKLETNTGVVGWGEGTLEGKASAVMGGKVCPRDTEIASVLPPGSLYLELAEESLPMRLRNSCSSTAVTSE